MSLGVQQDVVCLNWIKGVSSQTWLKQCLNNVAEECEPGSVVKSVSVFKNRRDKHLTGAIGLLQVSWTTLGEGKYDHLTFLALFIDGRYACGIICSNFLLKLDSIY